MRVLTLSLFATILSAPAFAADLGTYRPGTPYHSIISPVADICDSQCAGDAQCRGWNYVKTNPQAPGICEFLSLVSAPISSSISISGVNAAATPYSSRVTTGSTNTIRVGTQVTPKSNIVTSRRSPSGRRIVRHAPTQRITPQTAVSKPVENMSLTEQQNRYRQGAVSTPQAPVQSSRHVPTQIQRSAPVYSSAQPHYPQGAAPRRPVFRQHLDPSHQQFSAHNRQQPQIQNPQFQQPQVQKPQAQQPQRRTSRRVTGPRSAPAQPNVQGSVPNAPQFQTPQYQTPQNQAPQYQASRQQTPQFQSQPFPPQSYQAPQRNSAAVPPSADQQQPLRRGLSRPPVGQPIPTSQAPIRQAPAQAITRPQRSTPSQRLAQFTAQTRDSAPASTPTAGPISLTPEQAQKSLFGRLNDDVRAPEDTPVDIPIATSVPTQPVSQQDLGDVLAGGR